MSPVRPIPERELREIEKRAELVRWSDRIDEARKGSVADVFWNRDIPLLLEAVREQ